MPTTVSVATNSRKVAARFTSWVFSAPKSIGPVVGSDSTTETMTEPEITSGRSPPMSATNGLMAWRSGYLIRSFSGDRPLARPVTTYCFCSSSRRLARSRRIMPAVPDMPMTITGMTRCWATDQALARLIGCSMYSGSIRPPIDRPK
jgi:hypothetical protein